jgi:phosphoribosylaminoimidazole carboxylase PurE protein
MAKERVLIILGSPTDQEVMSASLPYYHYFGIGADIVISSAHRNPDITANLAQTARQEGYSAIVCGAGMAAHLAGACTAHSDLPVIGVPLPGGMMDGLDALLSTVQMPKGVPVATMSVGKAGSINSAVFLARMLSLNNDAILTRLNDFRSAGCKLPR